MTNKHNKRKYAGEPIGDMKRAKAPDVERLPPHKKPKVWRLSITWTETTTRTRTKTFTSKAARDEARARIERHFREEEQGNKRASLRPYWRAAYYNSPLYHFDEIEASVTSVGPTFTETYEVAGDAAR